MIFVQSSRHIGVSKKDRFATLERSIVQPPLSVGIVLNRLVGDFIDRVGKK
jgi:hypothetical protein